MNLEYILKQTGLSEKEAKIYLALLQAGKATAYTVAKHSGLKKSTVYVILDLLVEKGLVRKEPKGKILKYSALSPELLSERMQEKANLIKEALPEFQALYNNNSHQVKAQYYEGINGIREMFQQLMKVSKGKEYHAFYAHIDHTPSELFKLFEEVNRQHEQLGISRKILTVDDPKVSATFYKKGPRAIKNVLVKMLPKDKYDSSISIEIYDRFTQILSHRYLQGIVIENPDIAYVMRQIFELVWEKK
ncbi:MAG: TrmB family transcriptional regulator [Candidatus Gracilibacteria bacterium]